MTADLPQVNVYLRKTARVINPGVASRVAVVGAFDTLETDPIYCKDLEDAYTKLGDDDTYKGCSCLDKLFVGASDLVAVNITTENEGTRVTDLTTQNLTDALAKIKGENFDTLFVADQLADTAIAVIKAFLDENFRLKYPAGFVAGINRQNATAYVATAEAVGEFCYGLIRQQFTVNNTELSLVDSAAYYVGLIAGLNVSSSMTMKTVAGVTGVNPELTFETGDEGLVCMQNGITVLKCQDRINNRYVVVNSEQPNGYDLYINRVRDYVVKEFALHEFLGSRNRQSSLNEIIQELDRVKETCVDKLDLLKNIEYDIEKKENNCVDIHITKLLFEGVITTINVYITLEVE